MIGNRNIFVAYPYSFDEADYRRPFNDLEGDFGVTFIYADAQITSQHILDKITTMIRDSRSACSTSPAGTRTSPSN